jgi:hypothetical protein
MNIVELCDRYSLSKKALYNRFDAVNIKPQIGADNKAYVTPEQIAVLDDLDRHLKSGGNLRNYTPVSPVAKQSEVETTQSEVVTTPIKEISKSLTYQELEVIESQAIQPRSPGEELGLVGSSEVTTTLVEVLGAIASSQRDPLRKHQQLKEAAAEGWILTTSEIEEIIGVKPHGEIFIRGNWQLKRAGKIGRESAWVVEKV